MRMNSVRTCQHSIALIPAAATCMASFCSCCCFRAPPTHAHQLIVQPCALHRPDHEGLVGATQQLCWLVHIPATQHAQLAGSALRGACCAVLPASLALLPGWPAYAVNQLIPDIHLLLSVCS